MVKNRKGIFYFYIYCATPVPQKFMMAGASREFLRNQISGRLIRFYKQYIHMTKGEVEDLINLLKGEYE